MIFEVDAIRDSGLDFELRVAPESLHIDADDGVLSTEVLVSGTLTKVKREIILSGSVKTAIDLACARCLTAIHFPVDTKIFAQYIPRSATADNLELELAEADLDVEYYEENKINISQPLRDTILLALPMVALCREDCLGLCSQCGQDLNAGACACQGKKAVDPRFEILQSIKPKIK